MTVNARFPIDYYLAGKIRPNATELSADRDLILPNSDIDLGQLLVPVSQDFEVATFPPPASAAQSQTNPGVAWVTPSPRYPSDDAWYRDTTNKIEGSASANRTSGQADSHNSSLGLNLYLPAPARFSCLWRVQGESTFDFGWIYVDGVNKWKLSTGNVDVSGRFLSDVLDAGYHYIDFRFTKDGSVAATAEKFLIDRVEVIPESRWLDMRRFGRFREDFYFLDVTNIWQKTTTGTGTYTLQTGTENGAALLTTSGAANDKNILTLGSTTVGGFSYNREWIFEGRIKLATVTSIAAYFGLWDNGTNAIALEANTAINGNWQVYSNSGGTVTRQDTGIAFDTAQHDVRLLATGNSLNYVTLYIDGAYVQVAANRNALNTGIPNTTMRPYLSVQALSAAARTMEVDWCQFLCTR